MTALRIGDRAPLVTVLALALASAAALLAGCTGSGSTPQPDGTASASASGGCDGNLFTHHAGLASGAVHALIWKPYSAGTLAPSAGEHAAAEATAAKAAALAAQNFTRAQAMVRGCPKASPLVSSLEAASLGSASVARQLAGGTVDPAALSALDSAVNTITSQAGALGMVVVERTPTPSELNAVQTAS